MPLAVLLLVAAFIGTAGSASAGAPSPESPTGLQAIPAHWFASSHDVAHGAGNAGATGGVVEATTMHPMLAPLRLPDQADAEYSEHASQDVSETALAQAMLHPTLRAATGVRGAEFDDSLQAMQNIWRDGQPTDGDAGAPAPLFNQEAVHAGAATAAVAATSANVPGEAAVADETPMATVLAPDAVPDWPPADAAATVQVQPVASSIPANAAAISDVGDERKSGAVSEAADALEAPVAMDVVLASHSLDVAAAAAAAHGVDAASAELAAPAVVAQASVDAAASDLEAQGTQWGSDPLDETRRLRRRGALRGKAQPPATNIAASTARHVVHPGRGSGKLVSADAGAWGAASAPPLARPIAALPKSGACGWLRERPMPPPPRDTLPLCATVVRAAPDLPKLGGVGDGPRPGLFSSSLVWGIMVMAAGVVATVRYMLRRPARPEHRAHKPSAQVRPAPRREAPAPSFAYFRLAIVAVLRALASHPRAAGSRGDAARPAPQAAHAAAAWRAGARARTGRQRLAAAVHGPCAARRPVAAVALVHLRLEAAVHHGGARL